MIRRTFAAFVFCACALLSSQAALSQQRDVYGNTMARLQEVAREKPEDLSLCELELGITVPATRSGLSPDQQQAIRNYLAKLQPHALEYGRKFLAAYHAGESDDCGLDDRYFKNGLYVVDAIYRSLSYTGQPSDNIRKILSEEEEKRMCVSGSKKFVMWMHVLGPKRRPSDFGGWIGRVVKKYSLTREMLSATEAEWMEISP